MNPVAKIVLPLTLAGVGAAQIKTSEPLPSAASIVASPFRVEAVESIRDTASPAVIFYESEVLPFEQTTEIFEEPNLAASGLAVLQDGIQPWSAGVEEQTGQEESATAAPIGVPSHWLGLSSVDDWSAY